MLLPRFFLKKISWIFSIFLKPTNIIILKYKIKTNKRSEVGNYFIDFIHVWNIKLIDEIK